MPFTVSSQQVEELWRPLSQEETDRIMPQVRRAVALLHVRVPGLDERTDADENLALVARGIVVDMVKRADPSETDVEPGVSQQLQVAGPFTNQLIYKNPTGDLYVLDNEIALLLPRRARTVRTISTPPRR